MGDTGSGARRGFLVGYGQDTDPHRVQISLAGDLSLGDADLLSICRLQIRTMPVTSICLDLSALRRIDEAGAHSLAALCRVLRLDGLQVDVQGATVAVREELLRLGITLGGGRLASRSGRSTAEKETPAAASRVRNVPGLPQEPTTPGTG